jgi:hypothetical protein
LKTALLAVLARPGPIALASLGDNYIPQDVDREFASKLMQQHGVAEAKDHDPIERLRLNGVIVTSKVESKAAIRFALDPVAEYLAADHYVSRYSSDGAAMAAFQSI